MTPVKVLFVCKGNICRSPAAEGIFRSLVNKANLQDKILTDSCGTHSYHVGDLPDARMRSHAEKRGYQLDMIARKFYSDKDFSEFDYIITMDQFNQEHIARLAETDSERNKIIPMCRFCEEHTETEVPDPYYEGAEGFEKVLNLLEDATQGLLKHLIKKHQL